MSKHVQIDAIGSTTKAAATAKVARESDALSAGMLYKSSDQILGGVMFAYTSAILALLRVLDGSQFKANILSGMFGSATVVSHHRKQGNLANGDSRGMIRLTPKGRAHFMGRRTGQTAGQTVTHEDIVAMSRAIKTGKVSPGTLAAQVQWRKVGEIK
jgi:hypothetical protein